MDRLLQPFFFGLKFLIHKLGEMTLELPVPQEMETLAAPAIVPTIFQVLTNIGAKRYPNVIVCYKILSSLERLIY